MTDMKTNNTYDEAVYAKMSMLAKQNNSIHPELYDKYNVKRGLRNADGSGVLVGLTEIGDVHGYIVDEAEKIPVEGRLRYRGINVKKIAKGFLEEGRFGYEECAYLLLLGELPTEEELKNFSVLLGRSRKLPDNFMEDMILNTPSKNLMNKLARCVLASYSYDNNPEDNSITGTIKKSIELISKFPAYAAYSYQAKEYNYNNKSLYIHTPIPEYSSSQNFLHMIRPDSKFTESEAKILDLCLVLHAEHGGGNNSTFTTHVVTSSGTDIYSAVAAAIGSLKGHRHGGANIKVMEMMNEIYENVNDHNDDDEISSYLKKILNKEAYDKSGLIYGIGHAVYTKSDPRCRILREQAGSLADEKGFKKEFEFFNRVEELAPEVFNKFKQTDKVMCANVDYYSGFVYKMLGIPTDLYTPLFAVARITGWCAHRLEEIINGGKIVRPAYKNVLNYQRYISMDDRG